MTLYDLVYLAASPFLLSMIGYRYAFQRKYHESLKGMLGLPLPPPLPPAPDGRRPMVFWVHSVSVGEVVAAAGIIREIRAAWPDCRICASTITETGQAHARRFIRDLVDGIFYYPLDLSWNVERFLDRIQPDFYIMMETELWPNLLLRCGQRGIPVVMMNGKISERSFRRYRRYDFFFRPALRSIAAYCMQTQLDAERMREIAGPNAPIIVAGNCKFDSLACPLAESERAALAARWSVDRSAPVVVVGSTHPGEEEIIARAASALKPDFPGLTWIVAPRHVNRADSIVPIFSAAGLSLSRVSNSAGGRADVVLLDVMGELAHAYSLATLAVVCGSFAPIGGHNLLEPAIYGVPVLYGPHMEKQPELLRLFRQSGGGVQVEAGELAGTVKRLLQNADERQRIGRLAAETVELNRGSAKRHMDVLRKVVEARRKQ
ncbi:MAG: 3-deoxy-D-manno-octulosonic acid transferase [Candidatus Sumerlaeia bacterium]|nr:3-deoxy-D-manno-octulosonic acid transferase [Candidatus Sumerlaeia bacterium]